MIFLTLGPIDANSIKGNARFVVNVSKIALKNILKNPLHFILVKMGGGKGIV